MFDQNTFFRSLSGKDRRIPRIKQKAVDHLVLGINFEKKQGIKGFGLDVPISGDNHQSDGKV